MILYEIRNLWFFQFLFYSLATFLTLLWFLSFPQERLNIPVKDVSAIYFNCIELQYSMLSFDGMHTQRNDQLVHDQEPSKVTIKSPKTQSVSQEGLSNLYGKPMLIPEQSFESYKEPFPVSSFKSHDEAIWKFRLSAI